MIEAKPVRPVHYWRYVSTRKAQFGDYEIHGAWCGVEQFHNREMTMVLKNVTCERCKRCTKFQEDWEAKHGKTPGGNKENPHAQSEGKNGDGSIGGDEIRLPGIDHGVS